MSRSEVSIKTSDGVCPASVFMPEGEEGPWPAVIFFMDGLAIRPTLWEMGQRLADNGYLVLMPDLYYREGPYEPMVPAEVWTSEEKRATLMKMIGSLTLERKIADAGAFIGFLSLSPKVKGGRIGTVGYCMGGNYALTAAGAYPDRFAAIASFHGGGLATDSPDSPHHFVKGITGRVYVAGAIEDAHFDDTQKERLEAALTEAGVDHLIETYPAHHGFAVPDVPSFNAEAAERHWENLFKLLKETL